MARNTNAAWVLLSVPLLLCACSVQPTATPKMCQVVTCDAIVVEVMAWIDVNADGVQDTGEPPLPGVRFRRAGGAGTVSDESGVAFVKFMFAGDPVPCESPGWEDESCRLATERVIATQRVQGRPLTVEPEIPSGYRLTTPRGIRVASGATGFGFAPLAPTATPTT